MSRTLKRPMFRKGGEVMEGIMTGIQPRKMYALGPTDQGVVDDVRRKMNLIDVVTGGSRGGLGDPLTQFLLQSGQNLIAGESAGGTKLQEIVGATKKPLAGAIKQQQLKEIQDRKLATQLISKAGTGDFNTAFNTYGKFMINPNTKKPYKRDEFRSVYGEGKLFRKPVNPKEIARKKKEGITADLGKEKDFMRNQKYTPIEKGLIANATTKIQNNKALISAIDKANPYYQGSDYTVGTPTKVNNQEAMVIIPNDKDELRANKVYFVIEENKFFTFDAGAGRLIELPGI